MEKRKLPTLEELHHDADEAYKNDDFKYILNQHPQEAWLKKHPSATVKNAQGSDVPARYLPIDKLEFLLDRIFQEWKIEVLREGIMMNAVYVAVRVHYRLPTTGDWMFHDGVGAQTIQVDRGTSVKDISNVKHAAIMMALPSAKSYAIKDACDHIGKLFGRDINRAASIDFSGSYSKPSVPEDKSDERLELLMRSARNRKDLEKLNKDVKTMSQRVLYDEIYKFLK